MQVMMTNNIQVPVYIIKFKNQALIALFKSEKPFIVALMFILL